MTYINIVENYAEVSLMLVETDIKLQDIKLAKLDFEGRTALEKQELALMATDALFKDLTDTYTKLKVLKTIFGMVLENFKDDKDAVTKIDLSRVEQELRAAETQILDL